MIGIIVVTATLGEQKTIGERLLEELKKNLETEGREFLLVTTDNECDSNFSKELQKYSGLAIVVATGGTESTIRSLCRSFRKPLLLFCNPHHNSLASGLEVYGKMRFTRRIRLYYAENENDFSEIERFARVVKVLHRLHKTAVASFGPPSKWVLTSENKKILGDFGLEYHELSFSTLQKALKNVRNEQIKEAKKKLPHNFPIEKCPADDLSSSLQLYVALKELITNHNYDAVTICCFDLLSSGVTACLPLAMLNSEGIVAGCEGDVQALISMIAARYLTGKTPWMANPTRVSFQDNTLTLAHCSAPFSMLDDSDQLQFKPHKESGMGISFKGKIAAGKGTLLRVGGPALEKILLSDCSVVQNDLDDPSLCNIQLKLKLGVPVSEWIHDSLGNHQIFVPEADTKIFRDFAFYQNLKIMPKQ